MSECTWNQSKNSIFLKLFSLIFNRTSHFELFVRRWTSNRYLNRVVYWHVDKLLLYYTSVRWETFPDSEISRAAESRRYFPGSWFCYLFDAMCLMYITIFLRLHQLPGSAVKEGCHLTVHIFSFRKLYLLAFHFLFFFPACLIHTSSFSSKILRGLESKLWFAFLVFSWTNVWLTDRILSSFMFWY